MQTFTENHVPHAPSNRDRIAKRARITADDIKKMKNDNKPRQSLDALNLGGDSSNLTFAEFNNNSEPNSPVQQHSVPASGVPISEPRQDFDHFEDMMKKENHPYSGDGDFVEEDDEFEEQTDSQSGEFDEESGNEPEDYESQDSEMQKSTLPQLKAHTVSQQRQSANPYVNHYTESQSKPITCTSQAHTKQHHSNDRELHGITIPQRGVHGVPRNGILSQQSVRFPDQLETQPPTHQGHSAGTTMQKQTSHNGKRSRGESVGRKASTRSLSKTPVLDSKSPQESLDYDITQLKQMSYVELKKESFDHNPTARDFQLDDLEGSLEKRLTRVKQLETGHQHEFFQSLLLDEWDQAGDWFLEQFSELMSKMREARKTKRELAKKFEEDIAGRQMVVQDRKDGIVKAMRDMKESGRTALYPAKDTN
jgi:hypothetical protein